MLRTILFLFALCAQPVFSSELRIVTDIRPVGSLIAQVAKDVDHVDVLVSSGASAHHYNLRPSDVKAISTADIIVFVDASLTPWLPDVVAAVASGTETLVLNKLSGLTFWSFRENELFAGHKDDGHDHHLDDGHTNHDPHTWLDPKNVQIWLKVIGDRLAKLDPANASTYVSNAERAISDVEQLMREIEVILTKPSGEFVVYHDAYQYFERRFDALAAGSISAGDASPPSAARLASLRNETSSRQITCVFSEPQFKENLITSVFDGIVFDHAVLDPLGSDFEIDEALYRKLLMDMANKFAECSD